MILYCLLTGITCILGYFVISPNEMKCRWGSKQKALNLICIIAIFLLLFIVSACRDYVGADYGKYVINFNEIYYQAFVVTEIGYNAVIQAIYHVFGYGTYRIVFALFGGATIFMFLKSIYKESEKFFLSFFLFMTLGMYFISFSTMRYYFVLSFILLLMAMVYKGKYIEFIFFTVLLSFFHKSVLIIIPIYLLARFVRKKWHYAVILIGASSTLVLKDVYMKVIMKLYSSYEGTELVQGGISYISIFRCIITLALCILFYQCTIKDNVKNRFYFNLNYLALLLYVFGSFIPFVSRIGYYMTISQIILIPSVICHIQDVKKRRILTMAVLLGGGLYFALFLYQAYDPGVGVLPYKSWLIPDWIFW